MDRLVFSLLIAQGSSVFKQIFSGSLWSSAYTIFLLFFTTIFMYILASRPLITPEKFPDDDEVFTDHMIEQWYNQYRHPLVVRTAKDEKKSPFVNACKPLFSSSFRQLRSFRVSDETGFSERVPRQKANHGSLASQREQRSS
jgi:hypothetical protein